MKARHKQSRDPRAHWLLLILVLPAMFAALLFEGWTNHEVDAATTRSACTSPAPDAVAGGGPVVGINGNGIQTASMPARTVALTFDGGPDPVWTPRLLDLLKQHRARATFFLFGSQAARHRTWCGASAPRATRSAPTPTPGAPSVRRRPCAFPPNWT